MGLLYLFLSFHECSEFGPRAVHVDVWVDEVVMGYIFLRVLRFSVSRDSDSLRGGRTGDRIPVETRIFTPVQTIHRVQTASSTMATTSPSPAQSGRCVALNTHPHFASTSKKEYSYTYRGADKSLARPGRKRATATEDFEFHIPYLYS